MKNIRIAFCLRRDYSQMPAGDIIQMERWQKILLKLGCKVSVFSGDITEQEMREIDLAFIWHLERLHESLPFWNIARKMNKKIWLVPTCWSANPHLSLFRIISEEGKLLLRRIFSPSSFSCKTTVSNWKKNRQRLLDESDLLLVNSEAEKEFLKHQGALEEKIVVIPNTIDAKELENVPQLPWEERSGIVHIGHFCPRKNQIQLIKKLSGSDVHITFIGTWRPMHKLYHARCLSLAGEQHNFLGKLPHKELLKILGKSRLCISSSTSETPGLSNLEAAVLGCNLILPDIAPIREYFGNDVNYMNPEKVDTELIRLAAQTPPAEHLKKRILENYTEKQTENIFINLFRSQKMQ